MTQSHPHTSPKWLCFFPAALCNPFIDNTIQGKRRLFYSMSCWTPDIHKTGAQPILAWGQSRLRQALWGWLLLHTNKHVHLIHFRLISPTHFLWTSVPWIWGRLGALSTAQQAATGRIQIGTAVQSWHNLPLNLWLSLTPTFGRGAHEK